MHLAGAVRVCKGTETRDHAAVMDACGLQSCWLVLCRSRDVFHASDVHGAGAVVVVAGRPETHAGVRGAGAGGLQEHQDARHPHACRAGDSDCAECS